MNVSLCCLNMYNDRILLQVNSFYDGYSELLWYKEDSQITYKVKLPKDKIVVSQLLEGYYTFFTRNPSNGLETEPVTFYVTGNLPSYIINRLWNTANLEATTYTVTLKAELLAALESKPSASLLELIYKKYCSISELEEFEEDIFYRLVVCQETYENLQNSNYNRNDTNFTRLTLLPSPKIIVSNDVELIKVYKVLNNKKELCKMYRPDGDNLVIPLTEGMFEIHLVQGPYLLGILRHCNLSARCMKKFWDDYQNKSTDYFDVIENNLASSMNFSSFLTEEVINYKEEVGINPTNAIIPRIRVTEEQYSRGVKLLISGVNFATTSQHVFYVSGRDTDFLSENVQNEFFLLTGNTDEFTVNFEPVTHMIDKEALLYIIDEQGTIVSRVTRCIFDEDSTTTMNDYYEKVRQAEINSYGKRLLSQVLSSYPDSWTYVQEMITRCLEDTDINIDNILLSLLSDVHNAPSNIDKDLLSVEIFKDFISSSKYNLSFFSDTGIAWRPTAHMIVSEPSEIGYVLCIYAKLEGAKSYSSHYIHSFPDKAIEVLLNRYGSYIIYAVSELDYSYSGFIYLNTTTGFLKSYLVNLEVR